MLVGVEPAQRLAEHFGHTVAGVGARHHRVVQEVLTLVEAHRVIGAREDEALYTLAARSLIGVVAAVYVEVAHGFPRTLDRHAGEMDHAVDAGHGFFQSGHIANVGLNKFFPGFCLTQRGNV